MADLWHKHFMGKMDDYDFIWIGYPLFGRYIPEDYYGRDRINDEKLDIVIGVSGMYNILLELIQNDISAKLIGWQYSAK